VRGLLRSWITFPAAIYLKKKMGAGARARGWHWIFLFLVSHGANKHALLLFHILGNRMTMEVLS